jgi:hypothetical protein
VLFSLNHWVIFWKLLPEPEANMAMRFGIHLLFSKGSFLELTNALKSSP